MGQLGCRVSMSQYTQLYREYRDRRGLGWRSVSQYTPLYRDRLKAGLAGNCVSIHVSVS